MEGIVSIENFRICSSTRKIDLCQFIEVTSEFENIGCRWYVFWRWYVSEQHWIPLKKGAVRAVSISSISCSIVLFHLLQIESTYTIYITDLITNN